MSYLRGYYRLCLSALALGLTFTGALITASMPFKFQRIPLVNWCTLIGCRLLNHIWRLRYEAPDLSAIRQHEGFVFANHISYVDVVAMVQIIPMRFLAKAEVRKIPLIGYLAERMGCAFVQREDKKSRAAARMSVAKLDRYPPVALYPEGKRSDSDDLLPFRYGAFEIAITGEVPIIPLVIHYDRPDIAIWNRHESLLRALWRLARFPGPITVYLTPLAAIQPRSNDSPAELARATEEKMRQIYLAGPPTSTAVEPTAV